nr:hypothetical protein CFP56_57400 [Quercus suber]
MCRNLSLVAIEIELDAHVMTNSITTNMTNSSFVVDCRQSISQYLQVKVSHCYQKGRSRNSKKSLISQFLFFKGILLGLQHN